MESDGVGRELELRLTAATAAKYDPDAAWEGAAKWLRDLDDRDLAFAKEHLAEWLELADWHATAAIEIALLIDDAPLIRAAVQEARRRPLEDSSAPESRRGITFQAEVVSAIVRRPSPEGSAYLHDLAGQTSDASTYARRLISIRAKVALCFLSPAVDRPCIEAAVSELRRWGDSRVTKSTLAFIGGLAGQDTDLLEHVLTPEERRLSSA